MNRTTFATLAALLVTPAQAAEPDEQNWKPEYKPYFDSLHIDEEGKKWSKYCCGDGDCFGVQTRHLNGVWEAFIDEKMAKDHNYPQGWTTIPRDVFAVTDLDDPMRPTNGVVCIHNSYIRCFDPPLPRG